MSRTKDERYILSAYETARQAGDLTTLLNKYEIGNCIGLNNKAVDNICRLLAQANFIKVVDHSEFRLTQNGEELVKHLIK